MARFIVRRMASAILLLFAMSIVVFAIFEVIPSYNPARAIAGRNATPTTVAEISHKFGFDKPVYVQYANTMELIFTGQVIDYNDNLNVDSQFAHRFPVTLSLVVPAAVIWLLASIVLGSISALRVGGLAGPRLDGGGDHWACRSRCSCSPRSLLYLFAFKLPWFPNTGYVQLPDNPAQWAYHLFLPVALDRGPVHRLLLPRAALQPARHDQPGLRAHGPGQGPDRSGRCSTATCCATR